MDTAVVFCPSMFSEQVPCITPDLREIQAATSIPYRKRVPHRQLKRAERCLSRLQCSIQAFVKGAEMQSPNILTPEQLSLIIDIPADRYACYPSSAQFVNDFGADQYLAAISSSNGDPIPRRLSLHFSAPDNCKPVYCSDSPPPECRDERQAGAYLNRLIREISLTGELFDRDRDVVQISLDPGLVNLLSPDQLSDLFDSSARHFHVLPIGCHDVAATIDAMHCGSHDLRAYQDLGINRISFAIQSHYKGASGAKLVDECRSAGIANVRVDVIYGFQYEHPEWVISTLRDILDAKPSRVGLRDCAHLPDTFRVPSVSSRTKADALTRAKILLSGDNLLREAGYLHLGMDVYVLPDDPLAEAQQGGHLYRDALGFGPHGETDLIGFGVGAISQIGTAYAQSATHLRRWEATIDAGQRTVRRGRVLDDDDVARAALMQAILCEGVVRLRNFEDRHMLDFAIYFENELAQLEQHAERGLVRLSSEEIRVTPLGRLTSRVIAACFDRYRSRDAIPVGDRLKA